MIWEQLEQLDSRETLVTRDLKVPLVHRVQPAPVISVAIQDPRVHPDQPVARDSRDPPDLVGVPDHQVPPDQLAPRDKLVPSDKLELAVLLERLVHWD